MKKKILIFLKNVFDEKITWEDYVLHIFLFWANSFLFIVAVLEVFLHNNEIFYHWVHKIELVFGIIFLVEWIMRIIFAYLPNKVYFSWKLLLQFIVILSLVAPGLFWNLAMLRLMRSFKVLKAYLYKQDQEEMVKVHPEFEEKIKNIKYKLHIKK